MIDIDYSTIDAQVEDGSLRQRLTAYLTEGFIEIAERGDALPPTSYYAARIAEIIDRNAEAPLSTDLKYYLYQEILLACEDARRAVLGDENGH